MKKTRPDTESQLLRTVFDALNAANVRYCVLRNYASLPQSLEGSDLDILVHSEDVDILQECLQLSTSRRNGRLISSYRVNGRILRYVGNTGQQWWGLPVDVFTELEYRGLAFWDAGGSSAV